MFITIQVPEIPGKPLAAFPDTGHDLFFMKNRAQYERMVALLRQYWRAPIAEFSTGGVVQTVFPACPRVIAYSETIPLPAAGFSIPCNSPTSWATHMTRDLQAGRTFGPSVCINPEHESASFVPIGIPDLSLGIAMRLWGRQMPKPDSIKRL